MAERCGVPHLSQEEQANTRAAPGHVDGGAAPPSTTSKRGCEICIGCSEKAPLEAVALCPGCQRMGCIQCMRLFQHWQQCVSCERTEKELEDFAGTPTKDKEKEKRRTEKRAREEQKIKRRKREGKEKNREKAEERDRSLEDGCSTEGSAHARSAHGPWQVLDMIWLGSTNGHYKWTLFTYMRIYMSLIHISLFVCTCTCHKDVQYALGCPLQYISQFDPHVE